MGKMGKYSQSDIDLISDWMMSFNASNIFLSFAIHSVWEKNGVLKEYCKQINSMCTQIRKRFKIEFWRRRRRRLMKAIQFPFDAMTLSISLRFNLSKHSFEQQLNKRNIASFYVLFTVLTELQNASNRKM